VVTAALLALALLSAAPVDDREVGADVPDLGAADLDDGDGLPPEPPPGAAAATDGGAARGAAAALSPADLEAARTAWKYFERNYQPATGLVNSVEAYPSTTQWDLGSTIFATLAARELGLLDAAAFASRTTAMLRTLATQPLFDGALPNKAYDARTGAMTDYANHPAPRGIGASAIDLGRLASALEALARLHPEHRAEVARALRRWDGCRLVAGGELRGAQVDAAGAVVRVQEGRLGYEQYAAHGLERLGLDASQARRYDRFTADAVVFGVPVPHDTRDRRRFGAVDALVTDPWVLDAFESGLSPEAERLARRVLDVQRRRWQVTGVVTAASEDHVDRDPWFVYDAIWADGTPWRTVTSSGDAAPAFRGLSTKAAFALATLFPDEPYAGILRDAIAKARDPARGWNAGVYEGGRTNLSMNANTNGVILEALLFKALGPLLRAGRGEGGRLEVGKGGATACAATAEDQGRGPASSGALAPDPPASDPIPGFRLDGTFFAAYRGIDGPTAGGVATLWPWRYTFLRIGGEATPESRGDHGPSRLLWGIGYDDWHDGTFFLHVDNWGPIRPEDGLAVHSAEVNAGYRLPRWCVASALCFAPMAAATAPFAGGPYLSARLNLVVARDWFVMGGIGWTVPGVLEGPLGTPRWRVVYGFGRSTWAPGSLFVTYYDWGPSYHDRNGVLAVGINWGF
jgi:uncharacterized protein DUF3131